MVVLSLSPLVGAWSWFGRAPYLFIPYRGSSFSPRACFLPWLTLGGSGAAPASYSPALFQLFLLSVHCFVAILCLVPVRCLCAGRRHLHVHSRGVFATPSHGDPGPGVVAHARPDRVPNGLVSTPGGRRRHAVRLGLDSEATTPTIRGATDHADRSTLDSAPGAVWAAATIRAPRRTLQLDRRAGRGALDGSPG